MTANPEFSGIDWIGPAAAGHGSYTHRYFVWHCTENPTSDATGEANFARTRDDGIGTHFTADETRAIQTLETFKAVGHVGSTVGNQRGIALEMCGTLTSSTAHYRKVIDVAMPAIRKACAKWGIPARWLTSAQANDGVSKGWVTHDDARRYWGGTTHTDPGPNFDRTYAINSFNAVAPPPPPPSPFGAGMDFYTVTGVPAGVTDATGATCVTGGQYSIFQQGFVNWTGTEFFSVSQAAQDSRMDVTWPRFQLLVNLSKDTPVNVHDLAVELAAQYSASQITADVIRSAWTSPEGHAAFNTLLQDPAVQATLAQPVEFAEDH